jgi:AraC family transcriptional activator of pobA
MIERTKQESRLPFEVNTIEWLRQNRFDDFSEPHKLSHFHLVVICKGQGTQTVDTHNILLEDDTIYLLAPGQVHMFEPEGEVSGFVISFTSEFVLMDEENKVCLSKLGLLYQKETPLILKVRDELKTEVSDTVDRLLKEYNNYYILRGEVLRGLLKLLLIYLARHREDNKDEAPRTKTAEIVNTFHSLLEQHYKSKKMVAEYADLISISPSHLNDIVKNLTGEPASEHIKGRVVLEAKRMAMHSTLSMKEIAFDLGFETTAHFSKYFKNAAGTTFSDFKKSPSGPR